MQELTRNLWITLGILIVGFVAATATVFAMLSTKVLVLAFAAAMLGAAIAMSGNTRLLMLYAMIFLAPWNIKKNFMFLGHMAGASSFDFHISDPFLLVLVAFLVRDLLVKKHFKFRFPTVLLLWLTLMAGGVLSILFNPMSLPPAHEVFRMARWLLWILVLTNEIVRRQQFLHVAYALLIAAAAQTFFAYLEVFGITLGLERYGQMTDQEIRNLSSVTLRGSAVHRIGGIMVHPNILGAYLALHSGIALALLFTKVRWFFKIIISGLLVSFVPIIVLTLSRAAWIDFAVVILGVTLLTYTNKRTRLQSTVLRTAILVGIVVFGVVFSGPIVTRLTQSAPGAVDTRWEFIDTSIRMIQERPWFGWGLNTITFYQPPYTKVGSVNKLIAIYGDPDQWPVVHSSYLLVWVEQGTVGFVIWLSFHGLIILTGVRNLRLRDPTLHSLNVGLLVGYVAIMIDGLVSFFDRLQQGVLIFTFAGLIFALSYWRRQYESHGGGTNLGAELYYQNGYAGQSYIVKDAGLVRRPSTAVWLPKRSQPTLGKPDSTSDRTDDPAA